MLNWQRQQPTYHRHSIAVRAKAMTGRRQQRGLPPAVPTDELRAREFLKLEYFFTSVNTYRSGSGGRRRTWRHRAAASGNSCEVCRPTLR